MVAGIFHAGSGCGNQLHRYVAVRVLAKDKGYKFGMLNPENFKGMSFMDIDLGIDLTSYLEYHADTSPFQHVFNEKKVVENGVDIRGYDPEINFVKDFTIIDGEFQAPQYFEHRLDEVREWLSVEPLEMDSDVCVIGFRGGEYKIFPELFLDIEYWDKAISIMKSINPHMRFEVHTDDPVTAKEFFPHYPIVHDIGLNWRSVRYAKYLIIANSSFYIFPALLNEEVRKVIAPRFWARRSATNPVWALPSNFYKKFSYI